MKILLLSLFFCLSVIRPLLAQAVLDSLTYSESDEFDGVVYNNKSPAYNDLPSGSFHVDYHEEASSDYPVNYHESNGSVYGSDGTSYREFNDTIYGSDGSTIQKFGDTIYIYK